MPDEELLVLPAGVHSKGCTITEMTVMPSVQAVAVLLGAAHYIISELHQPRGLCSQQSSISSTLSLGFWKQSCAIIILASSALLVIYLLIEHAA